MHAQDLAPLFLASSSPRRRQLLAAAGIAFEPLIVPVDEDALTHAYGGPLERLGEYLACRKALAARGALARAGRRGLVLAADTTVLLDGESLAKPRDADEAVRMLRSLRGREHVVATGVALTSALPASAPASLPSAPTASSPSPPASGAADAEHEGQLQLATPAMAALQSATSATRVLMRDYADAELTSYAATGDPLDKAGGYSIQHPAFSPVASIAGCHLGVIGLPLCIVARLLGRGALPPLAPGQPVDGSRCVWSARCREPLPAEEVIVPGGCGGDASS